MLDAVVGDQINDKIELGGHNGVGVKAIDGSFWTGDYVAAAVDNIVDTINAASTAHDVVIDVANDVLSGSLES